MKTILIALLKALGLKKILLKLMDESLKPALEKMVARTDTDLDNKAMDSLYPILREELALVAERLIKKL